LLGERDPNSSIGYWPDVKEKNPGRADQWKNLSKIYRKKGSGSYGTANRLFGLFGL
jgi:hypothetical protein